MVTTVRLVLRTRCLHCTCKFQMRKTKRKMMMKRTRTKEMTLTIMTKTKMTPSIPMTMTKSLLSLNRFAWNPCSRPWTCTTSGAKLCQTSSFKPFLWRLFVRSCPLPKREPFVIWLVTYCDDYWSICFILFLLS